MRLVLDLQAAQSGSRFRGIGRYSFSLAKYLLMAATQRGHEVFIFLNGNFAAEAAEITDQLSGLISKNKIVLFYTPSPCADNDPANAWRHGAAKLLREEALASLNPDFVHVSTLLADCWTDDSIVSVGELHNTPTALTHYDLIPLAMQDQYLPPSAYRNHYLEKIENVKRADLLLAISDFTKVEAIVLLIFDESKIINISTAIEKDFGRKISSPSAIEKLMSNLGLRKDFLLYAPGGFDPRKNLNRLIEAYASLSAHLRSMHQLVIASKLGPGQLADWTWKGQDAGLAAGELVLTDYVSDDDLIDLYHGCHAYVFPSLHEGFGLPVLEAMACGAAVIASDCTSIPEAVGLSAALFDPLSVEDIAIKLQSVLTDQSYRNRLREHGKIQLKKFSWEKTAGEALNAIEHAHSGILSTRQKFLHASSRVDVLLENLKARNSSTIPTPDDLAQFRACFTKNLSAIPS